LLLLLAAAACCCCCCCCHDMQMRATVLRGLLTGWTSAAGWTTSWLSTLGDAQSHH
jgi:hypothetical protein